MASVVGCFLVIGFFQGSVLGEQQQNTLNVPQVLLPYAPRGSVHTNFTLKALQGCYLWLSNRPEVATVQPVYNNEEDTTAARQFGRKCSREALVTAQARLPERQMTEILAEEEVTSMILRSDVFVDTISKIEILTTTRELLLGEPPEVCHIQAFDTEGNVFSSLDGVEFVWELKTVEGVGSVNAESVLRFMQFEFSSYETCPEIYSLEEKGSRGSSIVVEPINTGTAIVKAKLKDKAFANVPPAQVKVIVLDNVMLVPGHDMYILVNTSITYSVIRLRQGRAAVVPMPSSQFEFKLSNTSVAQLDIKKSSVLGIKLGYTKVTLEDKNMLHIHSVHQPAAGVYVVEPAFLGFSITPHSDWFLEVGVEYDVSVQLYTHENRKIYITDNIQIVASFDDAYFKELWSSKNGSFYHVKTLQKGKTVLTALLTSIKILETDTIHTFEHPISGQQEAEIFDPVVVNPEIVLFPWYPAPQQNVAAPNQYQFLLQPSGGSGMYMWSSSNTSVATVSTKGVVMTTSAVGYSLVRAADMKNIANFDTTEVYVLQPKKMEFIPAVVEALVGSSISLPLAVASCIYSECQEFHVFTDCRSLPVTYTFSDPSIFKLVEDNSDYEITAGSCMSVKLLALRSGFTTLTVTYQYNDIILKAAITVGSYHALKVLDPVEVGVVSLCSAKNLMLDGGPLPWIADTSSYYEDVFPEADKAEQVFIGNDHTEDFPGQQVDDAVNKDEATKRAKAIDTSGNSNIPSSSLGIDLNFPLPNEQGPACLIHLYDQESTFKVNEMIEFIGILSVDPGLALFDQHMEGVQDTAVLTPDDLTTPEEQAVHHPPPSLVPRLHCLTFHRLTHSNPCLPDAISDVSCTNLAEMRKELLSLLTKVAYGDSLAAEYILLHLVSSVYNWTEIITVGKFALNVSGCPPLQSFPQEMHQLVEQLVPKCHFLSMTLNNMNSLNFVPKKDYTANRLTSGILQMSERTNLIVDETALEAGQLNENGVKNVKALENVISWQKLEYDFSYSKLEFKTNLLVMILSEGKSLLPSDCHLVLRPCSPPENAQRVLSSISADTIQQMRAFLGMAQLAEYSLSPEMQRVLQDDFVNSRQQNKNNMTAEDFHLLLLLSRLMSLSCGQSSLTPELWSRVKQMEAERRARLVSINSHN